MAIIVRRLLHIFIVMNNREAGCRVSGIKYYFPSLGGRGFTRQKYGG